MKIVASIPILD